MRKLDSELAYFRLEIVRHFVNEINQSRAIPEGAIRRQVLDGPFKKLLPEETEEIIRVLESNFTTTQKRGSAVTSDYKPWLFERRNEIDFYYWDRLRKYYLEGSILPPHVVATLDAVTDEILDYLGDPSDDGIWSRRGMVMGHVQSGKTTNYSALICKAADAGYKIIILLAGMTNSLRSQTQERLDETFIGRKSVFQAIAQEPLPIQTYAMARRLPAYGTSRDRDFTRDAAGVFFSMDAHNEPIIFITKKNKRTLELLRDWLKEQSHSEKMNAPLLLIDDEADNASINTSSNPKGTTAINGAIREILNLFERSSYIGYTATPFANIFIDPDNDKEMLSDDLFPQHFIKELDPPSTYVGAARIFADDGDLREIMVRPIDDYVGILPLSHKRDLDLTALPESLYEAIRVFMLSRTVRFLRGHGAEHCSMMINVSRFNDVQEKVLGLVYGYVQSLRNSITVNGAISDQATDENIEHLRASFDKEFASCGFKFKEIMRAASEAISSIRSPVTINMKGGTLDYQQNKKTGLHVIAIGGLALSRGLTLYGLTVSYILRNTAASDTLMQMARWFGYRPEYEDLCRVYLPQTSIDHYANTHVAIEELRDEVRRMQALGLTPRDFGLRVRQSPTAIRITAANKMRTATELTLAQDYSCRHIEGHTLVNDDGVNEKNLNAVRAFISDIDIGTKLEAQASTLVSTGVDGKKVLDLLKKFRFPETHNDLGWISKETSLLQDYISDRLEIDLKKWDVAIPHLLSGNKSDVVPGYKVPLRFRGTGTIERGTYRVTGSKNRVADPDDAQLVLTDTERAAGLDEKVRVNGLKGDRAYCAQRTRPLLIVHLFENREKTPSLKIKDPIVSLSFCLPRTHLAPKLRSYQVNVVYKNQMRDMFDEPDDDEAMIRDAQDA